MTNVDSPHSDADDSDHLGTQDNTFDTTVTCVMYGSHHYRSGTVFSPESIFNADFLTMFVQPLHAIACITIYIYARMF